MIDQAQLAAADQFHETSQVDQENIIRLANRLVGQGYSLPPSVNKALIIQFRNDLVLRLEWAPQGDQAAFRLNALPYYLAQRLARRLRERPSLLCRK